MSQNENAACLRKNAPGSRLYYGTFSDQEYSEAYTDGIQKRLFVNIAIWRKHYCQDCLNKTHLFQSICFVLTLLVRIWKKIYAVQREKQKKLRKAVFFLKLSENSISVLSVLPGLFDYCSSVLKTNFKNLQQNSLVCMIFVECTTYCVDNPIVQFPVGIRFVRPIAR